MQIPLHLDRYTPDTVKTAEQRYQLWTTMMRANPAGFRQEPGTGSTRRRPHNKRSHGRIKDGPVQMLLNGLVMFGRHGDANG